jgi:hypothetical protein
VRIRGCWLLALTACASQPIRREAVLPAATPDTLDDAFRDCGRGSVVQRSPTDYQVFACYQVASYRCTPAGDACRLLGVDARPSPVAVEMYLPPRALARPPGHALTAAADRMFEDGRKLFKYELFDLACAELTASDAILHTTTTAMNLAECALQDHHPSLAWQLYVEAGRLAVAERRPEDLVQYAHDHAEAMIGKLCSLILKLDDPDLPGLEVRIGERAMVPAAEIKAYVDPGTVDVVVSAPGAYARHWVVTGAAGEIKTIHVPEL